jgi:hypothetical protein
MSPKGRSPPMQPNPGTSKLRYPWPHLPVAPPSAFLLGQPERPCAPAPALLKRLNPGRGPPFMRPTKGLSAGGFRSWAWSIQNLGPARKSQVLLCRPYYPYPGARPNIAKRAPVRALRPVTVTKHSYIESGQGGGVCPNPTGSTDNFPLGHIVTTISPFSP